MGASPANVPEKAIDILEAQKQYKNSGESDWFWDLTSTVDYPEKGYTRKYYSFRRYTTENGNKKKITWKKKTKHEDLPVRIRA